jgi:sulfoxide reductase catalytic subunit YedY
MLIKSPKRWEIREQDATPESIFLSRRSLLTSMGIAGAGAAIGLGLGGGMGDRALAAVGEDLTADYYPFERNDKYMIDRPLTDETAASTYNNFYEFGSHKRIAKAAQALETRPWEIEITGEVEQPFVVGIDDLVKRMPLEERLYRHRCVERWSMTVPWSGFAFKALVDLAKPTSSAAFVRMETFHMPQVATGQKQYWYPWPYVEGLTMAEATNELAFLATGVYGKPLPKQFGAPLRLAVPWKYGFKSIKSIVKIEFSRRRPKSFWENIDANEYGFWANVNPEVRHARWSQAVEEPLGTGEKIPTQLYNGYEEEVAHLYDGIKGQNLYR